MVDASGGFAKSWAMLTPIKEIKRVDSPAVTPQALTWHKGELWMGSRDLRRIYRLEAETFAVLEEIDAPGIPWAAVSAGESLWFTVGEGTDDDRYLRRYEKGKGFSDKERIPCPDFTGSYLSYDGEALYLSQWYKHRILRLDSAGQIVREIAIDAEISGHDFLGDQFLRITLLMSSVAVTALLRAGPPTAADVGDAESFGHAALYMGAASGSVQLATTCSPSPMPVPPATANDSQCFVLNPQPARRLSLRTISCGSSCQRRRRVRSFIPH